MAHVAVDDLRQRIAALLAVAPACVTSEAVLTDLAADSFALVELAIELQEQYGVMFGQREMRAVRTVGDLTALLRSLR